MDKTTKLQQQIDKASAIMKMLDADYVTKGELENAVRILTGVVEKIGQELSKTVVTAKGSLASENTTAFKALQKAFGSFKKSIDQWQTEFTGQIDARGSLLTGDVQRDIQKITEAVAAFRAIPGPAGTPGTPGTPGTAGKDGSPDTPEQVIEKVNTAQTLIKAERVEGLADIERIAKANAFNPTMGPSFSDITRLQTQINSLLGTRISFIIDGGGTVLTAGVKGYIEIPDNMLVTGWEILGDQSGSIVVDVWKSTYAAFPPPVGASIAGSQKPTLSTAQSNQDLSLRTWTTTLSTGDILAYNVETATTVTRVTVVLIGSKIVKS